MKQKASALTLVLLCALLFLSGCQKDPTWQDCYDLGIQAMEQENYEEAISYFDEAVALDPSRPEAYSALADVYIALEDWEAALDVLQRGMDAAEDDALAAKAGEVTARLKELSRPQYLMDYLGMTITQVAEFWGEDYTLCDGWYLGGWKGMVYEDDRIPVTFYFEDPALSGTVEPEDTVIGIGAFSDDLAITEGLSCRSTYPQLQALSLDGTLDDSQGFVYSVLLNDDTVACFEWEQESAMATEYPAVLITSDEDFVHPERAAYRAIYTCVLTGEASGAMEYSLCDLDGNGVPELIAEYVSLTQHSVIGFDIYSIEDGMPFLWKSESPDTAVFPDLTWYPINDYSGLS